MKPLIVILVLLCLSVTWRGVRAAESEPPPPVADDAKPSPELQASAEKEIAQLSADDFDQRQAALKKLQEMDLTLLPWLRRFLKEDENQKRLDPETKARLADALKALEVRNTKLLLAHGSPVDLELKQAGTEEILAALEKQTGNQFAQDFAARLPAGPKQDFQYKGAYWGAIQKLLALFPPKVPEKIEEGELRFIRQRDPDLCQIGRMPSVTAGVCNVSVMRVAYEREAGENSSR